MTMHINEGYFRTLAKSPAVRDAVVDAAEEIAYDARASAPVDTGQYRDAIDVEVDETEHRVVARVVAKARHSLLVESKHGTLGRALMRNARG